MSESKVSTATAVPSARKDVRGCPAKPQARPPAPVSRDAQRFAAAILEVLAGARTPTEAAAALSLSVPRYYLWEQRALEGLVRACEPRPVGKASERHRVAVLEKELVRLRQDCARQQALVRASQRTIGLAASPPPAAKPAAKPGGKAVAKTGSGTVAGKGRRKRRPVVRALKAAAALQAPAEEQAAADSPAASSAGTMLAWSGVDVVQRSVPSSSLAPADAACASSAVAET